MKHLILSLLACLFLCTACFEKEEIEKEEEIEVVPPEFNILECRKIQEFTTFILSGTPKEPRASIKKYLKGEQAIFETNRGGNHNNGDVEITAYRNTDCDLLCNTIKGGTLTIYQPCSQSFLDSLVYIETVWIDER